jgi:effector-binding domain-containing protein
MWDEPKVVERQPQPYVAIKVLVTMEELGQVVPPLIGEVFDWLAERDAKPAGPPFWKYNVIDMQRQLEIEAGVAVEQALPGDGRVLTGTLPGGSYATLVHTGHPAELIDATAALLDWGNAKGLTWDRSDEAEGERWGARLEYYLTDPGDEPDMNKWETELAFRVAAP